MAGDCCTEARITRLGGRTPTLPANLGGTRPTCVTTSDTFGAPTLFSLATGAREQEVAPLKWDQECQVTGLPAGAVWWVPPEIRKGSAKKTRSEQQRRYLIANTMARSVINKLRGNGSDFLFPGPKGNRVERMNNTGFRNARKAANLAVILRAVTGCDTKRDTNKNSGLVTAVSA